MFTNTDITFSLDVKICFNRHIITIRVGQEGGGGGGGGVQWYTSIPEKNSPKYPKIPKIHPNIPKINGSIVYCIPGVQRK